MDNLLKDIRKGKISQTDESAFEVGRNVATTEGAVVFENELFQLIEYKPLTAKVYERPFLLVPPCINKFYILDLQPENSLIRYPVEQGHRVFVMSLAQPAISPKRTSPGTTTSRTARSRRSRWCRRSRGTKQINALGFCVGGTYPRNALAVLAARGEKPVDEPDAADHAARFRGHRRARRLHRREPGAAARDAVRRAAASCSRARNSRPPSASCAPTTWSGTTSSATTSRARRRRRSTCCTGTATAPTCRGRCTPGTCATSTSRTTCASRTSSRCCGEQVDLGRIDVADLHLRARARTTSCRGRRLTPRRTRCPGGKAGGVRFVLGASGHIAGVINPPSKNKRSHWTGSRQLLPANPDAWLNSARRASRAAGGPTGPPGWRGTAERR